MKTSHERDAARGPAGLPFLLAATVWVFGMVWQKVEATSLGYRVTAALAQVDLLESRVGGLRAKLEEIDSPGALAVRAHGEGLQPLGLFSLRVIGMPPAPQPLFSRLHLLALSSISRHSS